MVIVFGNDGPCPRAAATGSKAAALPAKKVRRDKSIGFDMSYPAVAWSATGGQYPRRVEGVRAPKTGHLIGAPRSIMSCWKSSRRRASARIARGGKLSRQQVAASAPAASPMLHSTG